MTEPDLSELVDLEALKNLSELVDLEALKNDATTAHHAASQSQDLSGFRVLDEPESPLIAATPSPTTDATPHPTLSSLVYRTHWRKATDGKLANNTATMPSTPAPETKQANDPATDFILFEVLYPLEGQARVVRCRIVAHIEHNSLWLRA